ncbi:hypothetical protein STENM223S_05317 [Streptomyces tendae]
MTPMTHTMLKGSNVPVDAVAVRAVLLDLGRVFPMWTPPPCCSARWAVCGPTRTSSSTTSRATPPGWSGGCRSAVSPRGSPTRSRRISARSTRRWTRRRSPPRPTESAFQQVPDLRILLFDAALADGEPLAVFDVRPETGEETAIICGELYRRGEGWKFRAVGQGYPTGLIGLATAFGISVDDSEAGRAGGSRRGRSSPRSSRRARRRQVGDQTRDARQHDGRRLVDVPPPCWWAWVREGHGGDHQHDQRDADRQHVDLAELGQRPLEPASHLMSRSSKMKSRKIINRNMPPKAAIAGWASVTRSLYLLVAEREVDRLDGPELCADRDDDDGEDQPHTEEAHQDADGKEDLLPEGIHLFLLQDSGVDHRVVEGQRDLQHREPPRYRRPATPRRRSLRPGRARSPRTTSRRFSEPLATPSCLCRVSPVCTGLPRRRARLYETLTPKSRAMPRKPDAYPCPTARNFHSPW